MRAQREPICNGACKSISTGHISAQNLPRRLSDGKVAGLSPYVRKTPAFHCIKIAGSPVIAVHRPRKEAGYPRGAVNVPLLAAYVPRRMAHRPPDVANGPHSLVFGDQTPLRRENSPHGRDNSPPPGTMDIMAGTTGHFSVTRRRTPGTVHGIPVRKRRTHPPLGPLPKQRRDKKKKITQKKETLQCLKQV